MKSDLQRRVVAASAAAVAIIAGLACSTSTIPPHSQPAAVLKTVTPAAPLELTETDSQWLQQYRERALDALMPLKAGRAVVAYRAAHTIAPGEMESYFAVGVGKGYGLHDATVVNPIGPSIGEQLIRFHRADPGASFESVLAQIKVQRLATDVEQCSGLFSQMNSLDKVRVPVRPNPRNAHLDGTMHRIVSAFVDVSDNDDNNPAAQWAIRTLDILRKCIHAKR